MKENKRVLYFDVLNILACFCVIMLHHNGIVHSFSDTIQWKQALIVEVVAYWAVPVFFMLTGATLLNYSERYSTKIFFEKRVLRIMCPFLFWSVLSLILYNKWGILSLSDWSAVGIINAIINSKIEAVYWFFPAYFGVCLIIPVLSLLRNERKILWYIVGISFIFSSFLPPILTLAGIQWNNALCFPMTTYAVYVIWGYLLSTEEQTSKQCIVAMVLAVFAMFFRYVAVYKLSFRDGEKNGLFFNYGYFTAILLAVGVFIIVKKIVSKYFLNSQRVSSILKTVSSCSFGIYLIHQIVMKIERKYFLMDISVESLSWRTIGAVMTYVVCFILVYMIKKIPLLRKFVP